VKLDLDDTIAALASPHGPARRGIIRVSGPEARTAVECIFHPADSVHWNGSTRPRCHAGNLSIAKLRVPIPVEVYLWPSGRSYTGQIAAELHLVGSPPLLEAVLSALHSHGARPARPGEFTLRAFLAGRVDLVQAEAVLGVIDAHDHVELETALKQLAGAISGRIGVVRADLLELLADLEAGLDFVEEDIEFVEQSELLACLSAAADELRELLAQADQRMTAADTWRVVLAGLPNAGKSTLFNAITRREAALVSHVAGTTRDYVSARLDWSGLQVELIDTAGREQTDAGIMQHAQSHLAEQLDRADLILWCSAADQVAWQQDDTFLGELPKRPVLRVVTKADLARKQPTRPGIWLSAQSGAGLDELQVAVADRLHRPHTGQRQFVGSTAARSRGSLLGAVSSLERAICAAEQGRGEELLAIELREALEHLGHILGAVFTDDILDRIFSKFCIGK